MKMPLLLLMLFAWLPGWQASARAACDVHERAEVAFTLTRGHLLVPLTVNGIGGTFVLDTGAERSLVTPDAVKRVGLFEPRMVQRFLEKWKRGVPEQVGYRDNMLMCFLVSTQLAAQQAATRREPHTPRSRRTIDVEDTT